jgi:hypothetical protein
MYQKAARLKLRFDSPQGLLSIEDLFDLPLTSNTGRTNLNDIAKALHKKVKDADEVDFVDTARFSDSTLQLAFDLVKDVIAIRKAERDAAAEAQANKERKQKIMAIIDAKKNEALSATSIEELEAELAKL